MVFSSITFLFRFIPIFMILYFVTPRRMRNIILFLGSLFFYAWGEPIYVLLMLFSTLSDYVHGRLIGACRSRRVARGLLISSIVINLGMLGFFKYSDFLIGTVNQLLGSNLPLLKLPLPIGISFYTFQTMSYTIDCYRGEAKVQKNLLDFGVFVTMFPQLIAGPIVKYRDVQDRLHERKADITAISYGCRRFVTGLAKKVLLANNLGLLWTEISGGNMGGTTVLGAWMGALAYAFQIYFDFSGYSDMAIGMGAILGFHFPENFNYPYMAKSVTDFWRRWHISLSSWFREYVYIPLGGNRRGMPRQLLNILIVWMLTGIWHGAGWNFLLWGLWFALWLILEKLVLGRVLKVLPSMVGRLYTWLVVLVSWVFFAIESGNGAMNYLYVMFGQGAAGLYDSATLFTLLEYRVLLLFAALAATPLAHRLSEAFFRSTGSGVVAVRRVAEKLVLSLLLLASIAYIVEASYNPFLYFRF
ncbi:peptidoglycan O-acetyltransferase [Lachnospiraceae bacterium]|nr:MBOAT family protein [Acetatifactor sp.]GFH94517.1 peptidoglycan O-acetyltransferase [Lachnospiraceae bacterium]